MTLVMSIITGLSLSLRPYLNYMKACCSVLLRRMITSMLTSLVLRQVAQLASERIFSSIRLMNTLRVVVMFLLGFLTLVKLLTRLITGSCFTNYLIILLMSVWYVSSHIGTDN